MDNDRNMPRSNHGPGYSCSVCGHTEPASDKKPNHAPFQPPLCEHERMPGCCYRCVERDDTPAPVVEPEQPTHEDTMQRLGGMGADALSVRDTTTYSPLAMSYVEACVRAERERIMPSFDRLRERLQARLLVCPCSPDCPDCEADEALLRETLDV